MQPSTFMISDGIDDIVQLIQRNIYAEAASQWCEAVLLLPYDLTDLEAHTLSVYVFRTTSKEIK